MNTSPQNDGQPSDDLPQDDALPNDIYGAISPLRGALTLEDGRVVIGRVAAPQGQEATSDEFWFWVPPDALVEKTQLVTCRCALAGRDFTFYGIIEEVHRSARKRNMGASMDESDGVLDYEPPFNSEGCTYALVRILRTEPPLLTPPRERAAVCIANAADAQKAYRADDIERPLTVGLVKNGGESLAGRGVIDLDYLLGENGGHLNVNGAAGRGTKSSFLMFINWMLLREARRQKQLAPSSATRLRIVPIVLNVKNYDLFYIDHRSRRFAEKQIEYSKDWNALEIDDPQPFENVTFFVAQQQSNDSPQPTGRLDNSVQAFSWSLSDIIERGLFRFLFSDDDANEANFGALLLDIENELTDSKVHGDGSSTRTLNAKDGIPRTFDALADWIVTKFGDKNSVHHAGTCKKLSRRLMKTLYESRGVLRRSDAKGQPLQVVRGETCDPIVIDLNALSGLPELQRFVVATVLQQLVEARTGANQIDGLRYVVTLDELNRFAPKGARDPVTKLIELVASEMRSQGVILLGAQQQASKVSEKVIENSAIRVLGKSGSLELSNTVWKYLSDGARRKAEALLGDEKLVMQDNFREPMHVRVPFPVWAMNKNEALAPTPDTSSTRRDRKSVV